LQSYIHAAKALRGKTQAVDVLARPLALVSVLFFITQTR
jgi:hypothetical protein